MKPRFSFIDLFAGIGGTRLGFETAGGKCVFSSEWDKYARLTYEANFGEQPAGDIRLIHSSEIPPHDVLVAGFPCQPFSIAGVTKHSALGNHHGFRHETQGTLFFELTRIIQASHPRAFVLENVKNLRSHDRGRTLDVITSTLTSELGYQVYWEIIEASLVVPQHRERIYIVGFREPIAFSFPKLVDRKRRLRDILEVDVSEKYRLSDHLWSYLQEYAAKHRARGNGFRYGMAELDGISRTLSARYHKDGSEILVPFGDGAPRRLTPRECARLMGFPDSFVIPVSDTQAYRQFGNSVVVPVVRAIAAKVAAALEHRSADPRAISGAPYRRANGDRQAATAKNAKKTPQLVQNQRA